MSYLSFGIRRAGLRVVVWLVACGLSSGCVVMFWPLGLVPFLALIALSMARRGKR